MNDVICPNCEATNRGTGRFCARCGAALSRPETDAGQADNALDLPWLQAVNEKAVSPTTGLDATKIEATEQAEDATPGRTAEAAPREAESQAAAEVEPANLTAATEAADAPPPSWVVGILEPSSGPATPEGSYEPEELAHIMPWAHKGEQAAVAAGMGEVGEAEAATGQPAEEGDNAPPGLPPWLGNVTVAETLQSVPQQDIRNTDLVELGIEGVEPFAIPEAEEDDKTPDQLPEFLRGMGAGASASVVAEDAPTQPAAMSSGERMITMPPGDIAVEDDMADIAAHNVPVRPPRPGSVEALALLLQPAGPEATRRVVPMPVIGSSGAAAVAAEAGRTAARKSRSKVADWFFPDGLIYLIVLAALLAVVIFRPPFGDTPVPVAPGVVAFYDAIDAVPLDRPVLVVYDWDAGRSAEMSAMSRAVMHHIGRRHLSFVTVSTVPQGPGFAQEITDDLRTDPAYGYVYGTDYLVLGYLPGSEAALRTLVDDFNAVLPLDYVNSRPVESYQLTAGGALNKIEDFALIVDLAGTEAEMRNWIEQVAARTSVPILAAVPQGLDPIARPYLGVPGAQLQAVVSGTTGAYAYTRQLQQNGLGAGLMQAIDLTTLLNAQSVAALLVALVIVAALLSHGARRIMRRK